MMPRMGRPGPPKPLNPLTKQRVRASFLPYIPQLVWIVFFVLVSAGLGILPSFWLRTIIDSGLQKGDLATVTRLSVLTLLATLASTGASIAYGYLSVLVGQRIMRDLRARLFSHLMGMPLKFFTSTRTGEIQSRLVSDVGGVQSVLSDTVANVLSNGTTVLSSLVAMFYFDWRLTLLAIGVLPLFAGVAAKLGTYAGNIRKTAAAQNADLSATMQETLSVSGVLLIKTSGRQAQASARFAGENEALTETQIKLASIFRAFFNLIGVTFSVSPILVYWLAGYLKIEANDLSLSVGKIVAFTALQSRLFFPLTGLLNVQVEVTSSLALFDRIFEYLDLDQEIVDAKDARALDPKAVDGRVSFENVTFRYEASQEKPTLDCVSFDARPGQLVALVGASGSGKTTLTYLIPRLYDAESGSVKIDGFDVKNLTLESLGKTIGVVTQETYLVHDTIRENLRYGNPDATDEQLIDAAKAAAIHDHIASLPDAYDTMVGERGYKLSGGEKQRVAIARAILKNPKILILDEATSALDTQSERLIQDALARLSKGRTTFAIAHRLSTILDADQILVLQKGKIVERGTHDELLAENGAYAALYAAQFSDTTIGDGAAAESAAGEQ